MKFGLSTCKRTQCKQAAYCEAGRPVYRAPLKSRSFRKALGLLQNPFEFDRRRWRLYLNRPTGRESQLEPPDSEKFKKLNQNFTGNSGQKIEREFKIFDSKQELKRKRTRESWISRLDDEHRRSPETRVLQTR